MIFIFQRYSRFGFAVQIRQLPQNQKHPIRMLFCFEGVSSQLYLHSLPSVPSLWKRERLILVFANIWCWVLHNKKALSKATDRKRNSQSVNSHKKIAAANATAINSFILRRLLLCLLWELELGHTCTNEDIKPRESLLNIRNVNSLAVVLGQHLAEVSLHLIGRLLV